MQSVMCERACVYLFAYGIHPPLRVLIFLALIHILFDMPTDIIFSRDKYHRAIKLLFCVCSLIYLLKMQDNFQSLNGDYVLSTDKKKHTVRYVRQDMPIFLSVGEKLAQRKLNYA